MDPITQQTVLAAAGAGGDKVYVDDVFSTTLYKGNSSNQATLQSQQIINGIDLSGEGGLVWTKSRTSSAYWSLWDTERTLTGSNNWIRCDSSNIATTTGQVTGFNNNGYTLGEDNTHQVINYLNTDYASWTFRKAPGFFDVVTYTGTGNGRTVPHNLGSTPGMIFCKCTSHTSDWMVWHRSFTSNGYCVLNTTDAFNSSNYFITGTSSTTFTFGGDNTVNQSGRSYVAYVFAHDDAQFGTGGDESIIKCGGYTGNGSTNGPEINLGFEPQFVFISAIEYTYNGYRYGGGWYLLDSTRGIFTGENDPSVQTQEINAEVASGNMKMELTPTGFKIVGNGTHENHSGGKYMYMAIRRSNKPPTAGTDVYQALNYNGTSGDITRPTNILVDLLFTQRTNGGNPYAVNRLTSATKYIGFEGAAQEGQQTTGFKEFGNNYIKMGNGPVANSNNNYLLSLFKRAPGFMDVVTYAGNSGANTIYHNLSVVPELLIYKNRGTSSYDFRVEYVPSSIKFGLASNNGSSSGTFFNTGITNSYVSTSNAGTIGNANGYNYLLLLFASLSGISKVGTYSGNTGYAVNVNCGFNAGARYILIKRTNDVGGWYVWNSLRGIVSGNDPYLFLNSSAAEVTNTDYIDPLSTGFTVTASAPAALNATGGTYLFLAIA